MCLIPVCKQQISIIQEGGSIMAGRGVEGECEILIYRSGSELLELSRCTSVHSVILIVYYSWVDGLECSIQLLDLLVEGLPLLHSQNRLLHLLLLEDLSFQLILVELL